MALVLERRDGESVLMDTSDGQVEITVKRRVRRGHIETLLVFDAPKSVRIYRSEIRERVEAADAALGEQGE